MWPFLGESSLTPKKITFNGPLIIVMIKTKDWGSWLGAVGTTQDGRLGECF